MYFKVDFPLPIVACNLMIEYSDFYENFQVLSMDEISGPGNGVIPGKHLWFEVMFF